MSRVLTRTITRIVAVAVAASASVLLAAGPAGAIAPSAQGWWIATNPGAIPEVGAPPASPPAPPDVPPDGLLVQGGQDPTVNPDAVALAALVYDVPDGATVGKLTLTPAPGSVATPGATLKLCPLVVLVLKAEQGGPMSDAPDYDCATSVSAAAGADGTFAFDVAKLVRGSSLGVAILPAGPTDRVVLSKPGADSLAVQGAAPSPTPAAPSNTAPTAGPSTAAAGPEPAPTEAAAPGLVTPADSGTGALPAPDVPAVVATADAPAPVVAGQPTSDSASGTGGSLSPASVQTAAPAASPGSHRWPAGALCAGLLLAAALWTYAGRSGAGLPDDAPDEA